jgi:hypothetical protein
MERMRLSLPRRTVLGAAAALGAGARQAIAAGSLEQTYTIRFGTLWPVTRLATSGR